jgi:hypothetical protein
MAKQGKPPSIRAAFLLRRCSAGRGIELRYDPFDLSRMEVYRDADHLGTAILTKHKRDLHLAIEHLVPETLPGVP